MVCTVCLFTYSKAVSFICAFYFDCFCSRADFYGYFDIFICLAIISWALKTQDKVIYGFALATFAVILGFLDYSLDVTFLIKSLSMFLSGLMLLLLTLSLMLFKQKEEFGI